MIKYLVGLLIIGVVIGKGMKIMASDKHKNSRETGRNEESPVISETIVEEFEEESLETVRAEAIDTMRKQTEEGKEIIQKSLEAIGNSMDAIEKNKTEIKELMKELKN